MSRPDWGSVFLSYACSFCGARPLERCRTESGEPLRPGVHIARTSAVDRCPVCGAPLPQPQLASPCSRCKLVRSLEVERSTLYVHQDEAD